MAGGTADGLVFFVVVEGIAVPGNTVFAIEVNIAGTAVFGLELTFKVIGTIKTGFTIIVTEAFSQTCMSFLVTLVVAAGLFFGSAVSSVHRTIAEF